MPRKAKPFEHQGYYYTTSGGTWTKLCQLSDGLAAAEAALARLLSGVPADAGPTLRVAVEKYLGHCRSFYILPGGRVSKEPSAVRLAFSFLLRTAGGDLPTAQLTREHLKVARELAAKTSCRRTCNQHVERMKRGFKWMVDADLMPDTIAAKLLMLPNLPAFRSGARETQPVAAVPWDHVRPVVERLPEPWASIARLQWWSGLRPAEACRLKMSQVLSGEDECFTLDFGLEHKSGWRGAQKLVRLGPQASAVLRPWVYAAELCGREAVFVTTWFLGNEPRQPHPTSYNHAVARECKRAAVPHWHPNRLRHSFATRVRAALGLEAAQHALGHAKADVTQLYTDRNAEAAARASRLLG